jgi:D-glycero-D-manno-heptose 1,7-bisphosphate phosphatase
VAAGHKSLSDTIAEMRFALELFPQIKEAYLCPDFEGRVCWRVWQEDLIEYKPDSYTVWELGLAGHFRKPAPGMLKLAMHIHGADEALMIGDRPRDQGAASAAGVPFMWAKDFLTTSL